MEDGEELAADENVKIVQHGARCSLTIVCPEGEDSGIYTCLPYNDSGHASCQAQLTVEEGETTHQCCCSSLLQFDRYHLKIYDISPKGNLS